MLNGDNKVKCLCVFFELSSLFVVMANICGCVNILRCVIFQDENLKHSTDVIIAQMLYFINSTCSTDHGAGGLFHASHNMEVTCGRSRFKGQRSLRPVSSPHPFKCLGTA